MFENVHAVDARVPFWPFLKTGTKLMRCFRLCANMSVSLRRNENVEKSNAENWKPEM
jgi:hypothetical protein